MKLLFFFFFFSEAILYFNLNTIFFIVYVYKINICKFICTLFVPYLLILECNFILNLLTAFFFLMKHHNLQNLLLKYHIRYCLRISYFMEIKAKRCDIQNRLIFVNFFFFFYKSNRFYYSKKYFGITVLFLDFIYIKLGYRLH